MKTYEHIPLDPIDAHDSRMMHDREYAAYHYDLEEQARADFEAQIAGHILVDGKEIKAAGYSAQDCRDNWSHLCGPAPRHWTVYPATEDLMSGIETEGFDICWTLRVPNGELWLHADDLADID